MKWMLRTFWKGPEREESCEESLSLLREYPSNTEQRVGRNMDGEAHSDDISDGNEEHFIRQWRKGHPCYQVL